MARFLVRVHKLPTLYLKRIDLLDKDAIGKSLVVGGLEYGEFCGYAVACIVVLPQEQFEIPQEGMVNLIETDIERTESRQMRTQHPMLAGRRVFAECFQPFDYLLQIVANCTVNPLAVLPE